jgi:hypothetical protein
MSLLFYCLVFFFSLERDLDLVMIGIASDISSGHFCPSYLQYAVFVYFKDSNKRGKIFFVYTSLVPCFSWEGHFEIHFLKEPIN